MNEQQITAGEIHLGDQVFCGGETCNSRRWRTVVALRYSGTRDIAVVFEGERAASMYVQYETPIIIRRFP